MVRNGTAACSRSRTTKRSASRAASSSGRSSGSTQPRAAGWKTCGNGVVFSQRSQLHEEPQHGTSRKFLRNGLDCVLARRPSHNIPMSQRDVIDDYFKTASDIRNGRRLDVCAAVEPAGALLGNDVSAKRPDLLLAKIGNTEDRGLELSAVGIRSGHERAWLHSA
jgi:hypothetical protein